MYCSALTHLHSPFCILFVLAKLVFAIFAIIDSYMWVTGLLNKRGRHAMLPAWQCRHAWYRLESESTADKNLWISSAMDTNATTSIRKSPGFKQILQKTKLHSTSLSSRILEQMKIYKANIVIPMRTAVECEITRNHYSLRTLMTINNLFAQNQAQQFVCCTWAYTYQPYLSETTQASSAFL